MLRDLMLNAKSEHVRFESARTIGTWAQVDGRDEEVVKDDRSELIRPLQLQQAREFARSLGQQSVGSGSSIEIPVLNAGNIIDAEYTVAATSGDDV
jgi:hypothetical protein